MCFRMRCTASQRDFGYCGSSVGGDGSEGNAVSASNSRAPGGSGGGRGLERGDGVTFGGGLGE